MKIKKIQIAAFGKLINFSLDLSDGFNVLYGVNESGKSTLMNFVQTMFYGFTSNARKNNIADNDREHYRPWHSQMYGGTILFEHKNRIYSLERNFGLTKAKDSTRLVFDATGKEVKLSSPDEPGFELFGMGKTEFLNTVFVNQMSSVINEDESIKGKLVSLAAGSQMEVSADKMKASLMDFRKKIFNDRKNSQSEMGTLQEDIYQLDNDLQEAYTAETFRKEFTRDIDTAKAEIHTLLLKKENMDRTLDAAKRLKEIDDGQKILALWQEIEDLSARVTNLNKPDASGRLLPTDDEIASAELIIRNIEQSDSNLKLLQNQASSTALALNALPQIDTINDSMKAIESCEIEWHAIEVEKAAVQEETHKQSAQYEQDDRALERTINQLLLDQKTMLSTYESKINEKSASKIEAGHNKSSLEQKHQLQVEENQRIIREFEARVTEDSRHLLDDKRQLEQETGILNDLKDQLPKQQEQLAQMQQFYAKAESRQGVPQQAISQKKPFPTLAVIGAALLLIGILGYALTQNALVLIAVPIGIVLIIVSLIKYFSKVENVPAVIPPTENNQIQNLEFQIKTLLQQIDIQVLKVNNLTRDINQKQVDIEQKNGQIAARKASLSDVAAESEYSRQIAELDTVIKTADEGILGLKSSREAEQQQLTSQLSVLQEKKNQQQFVLPEDLQIRQQTLDARRSAWYETIKPFGAESDERLRSVKDNLIQTQASVLSKTAALESTNNQIQSENDARQKLIDQMNQISNGYFVAASIDMTKEIIKSAKEITEQIRDLTISRKHLLDRVNAASEGKSKTEVQERTIEDQNWINENYPDAVQLTEIDMSQIRIDQQAIQQELQDNNLRLGQLTSNLKQLEQGSKLPDDIEREKREKVEVLAAMQSTVNSIDLAIQMIAETDDEMRQTFGPIINTKTAEYLAKLTGENNQSLRVENDFNVQIEDPVTHQYKSHDFFSGGKVDQIYLALRLAITDAVYTKDGEENMPFTFDDILVQYDQQRGHQAVDFLIEKCEQQQRQMIFVTCHDHIQKYCANKNCLVKVLG